MSTKKQILAGALGAILATLVIGIFATFYDFHGRLSRLEGQTEDLAEIKAAILRLSVQRDVLPVHSIGGLLIPAPTADRPVGGAIALLDTFDKEADELTAEKILEVFEPIVDPTALVTLVRDGSIRISDITLRTAEGARGNKSDARYEALFNLSNRTAEDVQFSIGSGQVFENQKRGTTHQNIVSAKSRTIRLGPHESREVVVDSLCLNRGLAPPDGSPGNITVFRVRDFDEQGQKALWRLVEEKLRR